MNWGQRVGKMNMKRNKVLKIGISLVTTAMMVIGTLSGIPMHANADTVSYDLYVGGYRVRSDRLTIDSRVNSAFSGTATYNPDTNTLTLDHFSNGGHALTQGFTYCEAIYYTGSENLTIILVGENTLTTTEVETNEVRCREGIYSDKENVNVTIRGNTFADTLNVDSGTNTYALVPNPSDSFGIEVAGNLFIRDCSVNVTAGDAVSSITGITAYCFPSDTYKNITIDHAVLSVEARNLTGYIDGAPFSVDYGICCGSLTIRNESIMAVSVGNKQDNRSYVTAISTSSSGGVFISNSKVDVTSKGGTAIYGKVRNDVPGKGWSDYAGTTGLTQISVTDLAGTGQNVYYKKVHFAPINTVTVTNGTCNGDGNYEYGDTVTITANTPASGYVFSGWTASSGVTFADANSTTTTFTMPASAVTVTANYRELDRATVAQIPTAKTGLTVNGSAQALINGGSATGGTLVYALGNADSATGTYSETIPTEMNAGTFYVWYKAIGDSSHRDSIPAYVTVTISENSSSGGNNEGKSGDNTDPTENKSENGGTSKNEGVIMYRLYNPNSGEHFYTASEREKNKLSKAGWTYEGEGWTAPSEGDPVYRLYNKNAGDHHYTTSKKERDNLIKQGWTDEGIGWRSAPKDTGKPLYRLYNPNATGAGSHHYTTSARERDKLVKQGWNDEGIAWYGIAE